MRCTQDMGFGSHSPINQEELSYLTRRQYDICGMFDECSLNEYLNANGEVIYREFIQFCPWSSGPMEHYAYRRVVDGKLFSYWKKNEVAEY